MSKTRLFLSTSLLIAVMPMAWAASFSLSFPVNCELGKTCFIALDKNTNSTDVILNTEQEMQKGVNVLAAADGKVIKVVNEYSDDKADESSSSDPCGNEVVIQHDSGWITQYCHLKKNSIAVTPNQEVKNKQILAQIGESGVTSGPKLSFMVLENGTVKDPFQAKLWKQKIAYQPYGVIDMGVTNQPTTLQITSESAPKQQQFTIQDKQVVAWVRVYGVQKGDQQRFTFYMPNGNVYSNPQTTTISGTYPQWFSTASFAIGHAIPPQYFGEWKVTYELKRGKQSWQKLGEASFGVG